MEKVEDPYRKGMNASKLSFKAIESRRLSKMIRSFLNHTFHASIQTTKKIFVLSEGNILVGCGISEASGANMREIDVCSTLVALSNFQLLIRLANQAFERGEKNECVRLVAALYAYMSGESQSGKKAHTPDLPTSEVSREQSAA